MDTQKEVYTDAANVLKIAKITLMMQKNTVFYTTILFSLKQEFTEEIPTAATDGKTLLINPKFFINLIPNERLTLLSHEVLHVALDHMHRLGNRDHKLWNIAGDYVINSALKLAGYALPAGGLYNSKYNNKTTEEVYNLINSESNQQKQKLLDNCKYGCMNGNDIAYPSQTTNGSKVTQTEVVNIILRASTQAKAMGQEPGSIPDEIGIELAKVLSPPLPWNIILQNYMAEFSKDDYSFSRPNKRFLPINYLPTAHAKAITNIAIAVDTSGSVDDYEFNLFITKIDEIQRIMKPKKITVISFDTKINNIQELIETDNPFKKLTFTGRGGTAIKPVHNWIAINKPTFALIFTDGEFKQVDPTNTRIPLIWLIHDNPIWKSNWGKVVHYNITQ